MKKFGLLGITLMSVLILSACSELGSQNNYSSSNTSSDEYYSSEQGTDSTESIEMIVLHLLNHQMTTH